MRTVQYVSFAGDDTAIPFQVLFSSPMSPEELAEVKAENRALKARKKKTN